nr:hypothetical protein CFP56_64183 [Quercus suber]
MVQDSDCSKEWYLHTPIHDQRWLSKHACHPRWLFNCIASVRIVDESPQTHRCSGRLTKTVKKSVTRNRQLIKSEAGVSDIGRKEREGREKRKINGVVGCCTSHCPGRD